MRKPSITQEIRISLVEQQCFGRSKHQDKLDGIDTTGKIYSVQSYMNYKTDAQRFARWAKVNHGCKTMTEAKPYIEAYLRKCENDGLSPSTIRTYASGICKAYRISTLDLDYEFQERKRADITRSRRAVAEDRHHRQDMDVVTVCKHTGLRRKELENTRGNQLKMTEKGQYYIANVKGKGGRIRNVPILNNDKATIEIFQKANNKKLFEKKVTDTVNDVHALRREYAQALYKQLAEPIEEIRNEKVVENGKVIRRLYACQKDGRGVHFDRSAMLIVSKALGHSRSDVVARNYLI